jgi:hypothetical protein
VVSTVIDWNRDAAIRTGNNAENRVGVWVADRTIRLFVNDRYVSGHVAERVPGGDHRLFVGYAPDGVPLSNLAITFAGAAANHFGSGAIKGVVTEE